MLDHVASGLVGLVFGAVLGLVLTVLFEDALKRRFGAVVARVRRRRTRGVLPAAGTEFRLGPLETSVVIIEGDGEQVIDEQAVRVIVDPAEVALPDDLNGWRREITQQQASNRAAGLHAHWNGPTYAVAGLAVERAGVDEAPGACLRLTSTDYFTFLATQQLDRVLPEGKTARAKYLDPYPLTGAPDFMRSSFGVYVAVITADDLVVFAKRSHTVGAFPGLWDASTNEALSRSLDSSGRTPPSLYEVARRGLREELALDRAEYRLELLAFDIDRGTHQWGCMFVAFLHELTGEQLIARRTRGTADKWEHDELDCTRFTIADVIGYLLRPDRRNHWTPTAPALFYLALVRRYGRATVEKTTTAVLKHHRTNATQ